MLLKMKSATVKGKSTRLTQDDFNYLKSHKILLEKHLLDIRFRNMKKETMLSTLNNLNVDNGKLIRRLLFCFNE